MHNIPSPYGNDLADFDLVCESRNTHNRDLLKSVRPKVSSQYERYVTSSRLAGAPEAESFSGEVRKLLFSNFSKMDTGKACEHLRMEVFTRTQDGQCPYCSLQDASSLDHIIERSTHPEFAVLRLNLAPVCERCNREKENARAKCDRNHRFHLYFDGFPLEPCLQIAIGVISDTIVFNFSMTRPASLVDDRHWAALNDHFESLDLASRYAIRSQKEMNDRAHFLQALRRSKGPTAVSDFLASQADSVATMRGEGYWLATLFQSAADNVQFCDSWIFHLG